MGLANLLQLVVAVLLLLPGQPEAAVKGRRVVRYRCQYIRTHNRTNIVCAPVEVSDGTPGTTATASVEPEAFNGQRAQREPMCGKLQQLAQRLAPLEEGAWKYCDPASCLRESPHCTRNVVSSECSQCLGRCWLMYAFPGAQSPQSKEFPCDPLGCGTPQLFCGGYKFKNEQPSGP